MRGASGNFGSGGCDVVVDLVNMWGNFGLEDLSD